MLDTRKYGYRLSLLMGIYDGQFGLMLNDEVKDLDAFKGHVVLELRKDKTHKISEEAEETTFERRVLLDFPAPLQYVRGLKVKFLKVSGSPELFVKYSISAYPYLLHFFLGLFNIAFFISGEFNIGLALTAVQPIGYWLLNRYLKSSVQNFFMEIERTFLRKNDPYRGTIHERKY